MKKRKDVKMDLPKDGSDTELAAPTGSEMANSLNNHALGSAAFQLPISGLKPKLDSIFSEVEKNLPEIDFDLSDVESDGDEPLIFHHHLKSSGFDEEKDLDTSQESDTLGDIKKFNKECKETKDTIQDKNIQSESSNDPSVKLYDNDLAFELQKHEVTSWSSISKAEKLFSKASSDHNSGQNNAAQPLVFKNRNSSSNQNNSDDGEVQEKDKNVPRTESQSDRDDRQLKKQVERQRSRTKEKDLVSSFLPSNGPVLSTSALDNINLDLLLQSLNDDNQLGPPRPRTAWGSDTGNTISVYAGGEGRKGLSQNTEGSEGMTLIQRLAQMTMDQCNEDLTDIDPRTGARLKQGHNENALDPDNRDLDRDLEDTESEEIQAPRELSKEERVERELASIKQHHESSVPKKKSTASCGTNTNDFTPRILTPRFPLPPIPPPSEKKSEDKEPTVFIDLRNFDQLRQEQQQSIERVQRVLGIDPDERQDDSSDSEDDTEDWQSQRRRFKETVLNRDRNTEPLPPKPPTTSFKKPQRVINLSEQVSPRSHSDGQLEERISSEEAESRRRAAEEEKEKQRRQEIARKLREQKEHERQAKLRLQKRLEAMKPAASISGRHDAAEATPTLFDMDASYEPAPRSLPTVVSPDRDCLLLNIHLSSNGEIILHRGKSNKSVDTGDGLSASYTSLLSWLLSLVPDNFTYLQKDGAIAEPEATPWLLPFHVIGCQQALIDDQLCLIVAVTPVEQFNARYIPMKTKKSKQKDEVKGTSAFHQHLTKFLATNSLLTVCPWLQDMVSMEMTSMQERSENEYVYRPPLPNITTKPLSTFIQINPDPQAAGKVFNTSIGFFWQTVDNDERQFEQEVGEEGINFDTQNTMSLVYKKIFKDPRAMMGIFNRVLQEGLDLAGVRLLYPTPELLNLPKVDNSEVQSEIELLNNIGPVLAVALRGTLARSIWLDAVGPSDPVLARRTDPNSLCALYGGTSREECLLFTPRNPARVLTELARWFGGRVPPGNVIDVGAPYTKKDVLKSGSPKGRKTKKVTFSGLEAKDTGTKDLDFHPIHRPMASVTATTRSEIFLVLSTLVPPKSFGIVLATSQRRGYQLRGIKRCRLSTKRAASLGITSRNLMSFCPGTPTSPGPTTSFDEALSDHLDPQKHGKQQEATSPATILLLQKENACHSAASLVEACMVQLTLQGLMAEIQRGKDYALQSCHMFHAARYSDGLLATLGSDFSKCFDPEIQINPSYVIPQLYSNPELEQITVLLLLGHNVLKTCGLFVGRLLNMVPYSKNPQVLPFSEGLELLGLKWLPSLTPTQAKEVTPWEVGDRQWKGSLHTLTTEPCLALIFRGVNAFRKLESVIPSAQKTGSTKKHTDMVYSRSPEEAYSFARLFFTERELFADNSARPLLPYIPNYLEFHSIETEPSKKKRSKHLVQSNPNEESIFDIMLAGPQHISTFLLIKPRALQRHLAKILKKITQEGFAVIGLRLQVLDETMASLLLPECSETSLKEKHMKYLTSGPSMCLSLQRENAVRKLLDLLGPEDPQAARRNSQFYWRGVFGADVVSNGFYASADYNQAVEDQKRFFPDGLCCEPTEISQLLQIVCPAVDTVVDVKFSSNREVTVLRQSADGISGTPHQLLLQTTCIVLTPPVLKKLGAHYAYVDVVEGLISQGFEFVGARMIWFTQELAETCLCLAEAGSFKQVPLLLSGPSIVLALQRDNAVVTFDSLMTEAVIVDSVQGKTSRDSVLSKYGPLIIRPTEVKQAHSLLGFFFDELLPNSQVKVVSKSPVPDPVAMVTAN